MLTDGPCPRNCENCSYLESLRLYTTRDAIAKALVSCVLFMMTWGTVVGKSSVDT
jgi:hypothetical protein